MYKCDLCDKMYKSLRGMYQHYYKAHNLSCKIYYDKFIRKPNEGICPICGKETTFTNGTIGYTKYCSCKCATNDINYKQNKINNCIKIHGVRSTNELSSVKKKKEKTCLKNHGVKSPWQSKEIYKKAQETFFKKHGYTNNLSDETFRKIVEKTNIKKYGKKSYSQTDDFKNTVLKDETGEYRMTTDDFKNKSKKTKYDRYGNENWLNPEKIKSTMIERYGVENCMQNHDIFKKTKKKYFYDNKNFDSAPELYYYIWLKDHNIEFEYQPNKKFIYYYDNKERNYFADFKVGEEYQEIKGLQFFENKNPNCKMICPWQSKNDTPEKIVWRNGLYEAKHQCMLNNNIKIITDYSEYENYIIKKYGKDYISTFRKK